MAGGHFDNGGGGGTVTVTDQADGTVAVGNGTSTETAIQPVPDLDRGLELIDRTNDYVVVWDDSLQKHVKVPVEELTPDSILGFDPTTNELTLINESGAVTTLDLSGLAVDINVASLAFNAATGELTLTETDGTPHTVTVGAPLSFGDGIQGTGTATDPIRLKIDPSSSPALTVGPTGLKLDPSLLPTIAVTDQTDGTVRVNAGSGGDEEAIRSADELPFQTGLDPAADALVMWDDSTQSHKRVLIKDLTVCTANLDLTPVVNVTQGATDVSRSQVVTVTFPGPMAATTAGLLQMTNTAGVPQPGTWVTSDNTTFTWQPNSAPVSASNLLSQGFEHHVKVPTTVRTIAPNLCPWTSNVTPVDRSFTTAFRSALARQTAGLTASGVFTIHPDGQVATIDAFCDQVTDGGGWTMVWSYSETESLTNPAYGAGNVEVGAAWALNQNNPQDNTAPDGSVTFNNHRMTLTQMRGLKNPTATAEVYRSRTTATPTVEDAVATAWNLRVNPTTQARSFVYGTSVASAYQGPELPTVGRLNNVPFTLGQTAALVPTTGGSVNGVNRPAGLTLPLWYGSGSGFPEHLDTYGLPPIPNGSDTFGYFGTTPTLEWGATQTTPHTPVRYQQWFIR